MDNDKFQELVLQQLQTLAESNKTLTANQRQTHEMVTQLVRIVGNTNAIVEELRADVAELKTDVVELKAGQAKLESDVAELKTNVTELKAGQERLEKNQTMFKQEIIERLDTLDNAVDYLAYKFLEHDMQIFRFKRKKAILE